MLDLFETTSEVYEMLNGLTYSQFKGSVDDLNFRRATEEESANFRRLEKIHRGAIPISIVMVFICLFFFLYVFKTFGMEPLYMGACGVFMLLAILNVVRIVLDCKVSDSYEVANGVVVMRSEINNRQYVSVWCEEEQIYIKKVRYISPYRCAMNMPVVIIRGNRDGKKPHIFAAAAGGDPLFK